MTIYRVHQDDNYLSFEIPTMEVINKLGREYPFHINRSPIAYSNVWSEPLNIKFRAAENHNNNSTPDISAVDGKLFFNKTAYIIFKDLLLDYGEFLPITYDHDSGYIFNPLKIADDINGLDTKLIAYDENGNLENFAFVDQIMEGIPIFRTKIDNYQGIFCNEVLKTAFEKANLNGIYFHIDIANPIGEAYGISH